MMVKRAMILAAGFGTRLGAMTQATPKPLICIGGQPILFHILDALSKRGLEEVVINTHYLAEQIHQSISIWRAQTSSDMSIHISHEVELLEIGGGMRYAQKYLKNEPFLVVNGDIVWQENRTPLLDELINTYDATKMDALMVLTPLDKMAQPRERGDVLMDVEGSVHFPNEEDVPTHVYAGIQVIHPRTLEALPEGRSALRPAWRSAEKSGKLHGFIYEGLWTDMGTLEGLEIAKSIVQKPQVDKV